jgi:hypothetical protein
MIFYIPSLSEVKDTQKQLSATCAKLSPSTPASEGVAFNETSPVLPTTLYDISGWTLYYRRVLGSKSADIFSFQNFEFDSRTTSAELGAEPNLFL